MTKYFRFLSILALLLAFTILPVSAKYVLNLLSRMPPAVVTVDAGSEDINYSEVFPTYEAAKAAIDDWNLNCTGKYADQLKVWEDWNAECKSIVAKADKNTTYKEMGPASTLTASVYKKVKDAGLADATLVEITVPTYELPSRPKLEGPYFLALCAINQLAQDGLQEYEWVFLKFVLFDLPEYRKSGISYAYMGHAEEGVQRLVDRGYVEAGKHKKAGLEAITGESSQKFDCKVTAKGKEYLHNSVNRLWSFRNGLITEAATHGDITEAERKQLSKDNDFLKTAFNKQVDNPQDWEATQSGDQNMVNMLKLVGAAGDYPKVKEALKSFAVQDDKEGSTPYGRVLRCLPHLENVPDPQPPAPLESGTFLRVGANTFYALNKFTR